MKRAWVWPSPTDSVKAQLEPVHGQKGYLWGSTCSPVCHYFVPSQVCLQDKGLEMGSLGGRTCVSFPWPLSHKRGAQDNTEPSSLTALRSQVQNQFHRAKIQALAGQIPPADSKRSMAWPFSASGGQLSSVACGHFLYSQGTLNCSVSTLPPPLSSPASLL